ncbi:Hypothetical predicted protein [Octopus vulgaris]|uniref:Uncharacterized protein n=1 Tax=Octopus vulgaris TaxID=6645 RepID=A0AA36EUX8_OCTVU|nr:Hypothetical predicted protein [Octopus vulgaris]
MLLSEGICEKGAEGQNSLKNCFPLINFTIHRVHATWLTSTLTRWPKVLRVNKRTVGDIVNWNNTPEVLAKLDGKLETDDKKLKKPCEGMDTCEKAPKVYGKNLRDKDGNYPEWMNNKQKHKQKLRNKRMKARKMKNKKRIK